MQALKVVTIHSWKELTCVCHRRENGPGNKGIQYWLRNGFDAYINSEGGYFPLKISKIAPGFGGSLPAHFREYVAEDEAKNLLFINP